MKNIIKHILALTIIFIILLVIGIIYSITNTAKADTHPMFPPGTMKQTMSPIFCGIDFKMFMVMQQIHLSKYL